MEYQEKTSILAALEQLGQNLADARRRRQLSQVDLARRAGVSRDTVYRAEKGEPVGTDALAAMLLVLNALDDFSSMLSLLRDATGRALEEQQSGIRRVRKRKAAT